MKAGRPPSTARPDMQGLMLVPKALGQLHGERHAPELPVPRSAIQRHADRLGFTDFFVTLVSTYDEALLAGAQEKLKAQQKAQSKSLPMK